MEPFRPGMRADEIRILRLLSMAETYSRYQTDLFIGPFPPHFVQVSIRSGRLRSKLLLCSNGRKLSDW